MQTLGQSVLADGMGWGRRQWSRMRELLIQNVEVRPTWPVLREWQSFLVSEASVFFPWFLNFYSKSGRLYNEYTSGSDKSGFKSH